jgi:hypothetical protein
MRAESIITKAIAVIAASCAIFAPTAFAQSQDLRSPDQQAPAPAVKQDLRSPDTRLVVAPKTGAVVSSGYRDLRSPDAVDAAAAKPEPIAAAVRTDLRSPDAVDAGRDIPQPVPAPVSVTVDDGFQWGDAGIGGAVMAGLAALVLTGVVLRRRHDSGGMGTPAVSS